MKLVIQTQHRENYSDDPANPYWKNKGGDTYVVPDITENQYKRILNGGIPTLKSLIETENESFTDTIIDYSFADDAERVCEEWETPIILKYNKNIGRWTAMRTQYNDEYAYMRKEILRKTNTWELLPGGEMENHNCSYVVDGYGVVGFDNINAVLKEIDLLCKI